MRKKTITAATAISLLFTLLLIPGSASAGPPTRFTDEWTQTTCEAIGEDGFAIVHVFVSPEDSGADAVFWAGASEPDGLPTLASSGFEDAAVSLAGSTLVAEIPMLDQLGGRPA